MTRTKQTALQRDVEFVIDSMSVNRDGRVWMKRFLRRLVREAVREALLWQIIADDSEQAAVETIAKRLVP